LETSVLFYDFHNFIAQLRAAKKFAIGMLTLGTSFYQAHPLNVEKTDFVLKQAT
jgi:hypothetical protein